MRKVKGVKCPHCAGTGQKADPVSLGRELQRLRKAKGVSLRKFATAVETSVTHLSDIERGLRSPSNELLARILAKLGEG